MKKKLVVCLVLASVITGCTSSKVETTSPTPSIQPISTQPLETPTPLKMATPTLTAIVLPTKTHTPLPSPSQTPTESPFLEIQQQCLEVREGFQPNMLTDGNLLFISSIYDTDLDKGTEDGDGIGLLTSQGMQAYPQFRFSWSFGSYEFLHDKKYFVNLNEEMTELAVINVEGEIIATVPWQDQWPWIGTAIRTFNEDQVIFSADLENPGPAIVLNPFTGEIQEVVGDFPDIFNPNKEVELFEEYWGNPNHVEFNSTLTHAAYLGGSIGNLSLVLWDLEANEELWRQAVLGYLSIPHPVWSPSDTYLVAALPVAYEPVNLDYDGIYYELFSITQDGIPKQLTNFKELYSPYTVILGEMAWSPDGKYLAFSLNFNQGNENKTKLLIYEPAEEKLFDYCVIGDDYIPFFMKIFWSPDSQQMIVSVARTVEDAHAGQDIYLVDPTNEYITKLGEDWQIIGWMADAE